MALRKTKFKKDKHGYLSAKQLEISGAAKKGLAWIIKQIDKGKVVHVAMFQRWDVPSDKIGFNMGEWGLGRDNVCGTVHCIGGLLQAKRMLEEADEKVLHDLFFPPNHGMYGSIPLSKVRRVIDRFLKTSVIRWY